VVHQAHESSAMPLFSIFSIVKVGQKVTFLGNDRKGACSMGAGAHPLLPQT